MKIDKNLLLDDLRRPLSEIIRPNSIKNVIGQKHLLNSANGAITNFITLGYLPSMILHGPPGVGKTTLARLLANETNYVFVEFSATDATVSQIRELLQALSEENVKRARLGQDRLRVVVFIDEIHRFTVVQQDFLLPFVESGAFVFVGATTVSPEKRIRRAILSRCQLFELKKLTVEEVKQVVEKALVFENIRRRILSGLQPIVMEDGSSEVIAQYASGDGRTAINFVDLLSAKANEEMGFEMSKSQVEKAIRSLLKEHSGLRNSLSMELIDTLYDFLNQKAPEETVMPEKAPKFVHYSLGKGRKSCMVTIKYKAARDAASDLESCYENLTNEERFSDDENDEKGAIYLDEENEIPQHVSHRISNSKYFLRAAAHIMLQLLSRGELASLIVKHLLLFNCTYIDAEALLLQYIMSLSKSFQKSTLNIPVALSNCAERLILARKTKGEPFSTTLQELKRFFSSRVVNPDNSTKIGILEVVQDKELLATLMVDPREEFTRIEPEAPHSIVYDFSEGDFTLGHGSMSLLET